MSSSTLPAAPGAVETPPGVVLQTVKYDQLAAAVRAQRGKIVVVDVWGAYWFPCKEAFPHLVEMQQRYGKDGLVCMSVSVDEPEAKDDALKFLKAKQATFANYWLDEDTEVWQQKWKFKAPPAAFVFDREGKRAAKFDNDDPDAQYNYEDVEKLVKKLLYPER